MDFIPAAAMIGPLPEEAYIEINIEESEQGEAERIQERIVLKAKKTKPRWACQCLILLDIFVLAVQTAQLGVAASAQSSTYM